MASNELIFLSRKHLLEITPIVGNVTLACQLSNCSRTHYYHIKKLYRKNGIDGLQPKSRKKPNLKNRLSLVIENSVIEFSLQNPLLGQLKVSKALADQNVFVNASSVRNIWIRHNIETREKRLKVAQNNTE